MQQIYETDRLILKSSDVSFTDLVFNYYLRNQSFLKEWEPLRDTEYYTKTYQKKLLEEDAANPNSVIFWIFKKEEADKIIGSFAFTNISRGAFLSCFLGYKLDQEELNKGYMTEAVRQGIKIMFEDLGLHRIEANIMPRNKRSMKVTEKLGFFEEGLSRKYLKINGIWEDHIHMVLLNEEIE
ncbi:GNAT family N-acetyltransferase [Lacrimispora sp. JR3]|uniref:GNAT family N-acetyltransferase n=1 Tax=Lacrimispora sinapis TaxID=3111456 RepID=UPI003748CFD1